MAVNTGSPPGIDGKSIAHSFEKSHKYLRENKLAGLGINNHPRSGERCLCRNAFHLRDLWIIAFIEAGQPLVRWTTATQWW